MSLSVHPKGLTSNCLGAHDATVKESLSSLFVLPRAAAAGVAAAGAAAGAAAAAAAAAAGAPARAPARASARREAGGLNQRSVPLSFPGGFATRGWRR